MINSTGKALSLLIQPYIATGLRGDIDMKKEDISLEIGRLLYLCCEQPIHSEAYESISKLITALRNVLDMEFITQGIIDIWDEYEFEEITNEDIIKILEEFNLSI
jgi:hypothetical protein